MPPAPPKARRVKSRGSKPRSTLITRSARTICASATSTTPIAVSSADRPSFAPSRRERRLRAGAVEHDLAAEARAVGEVAEVDVGVGDRRLLAAEPVARGAGLGSCGARADPQRSTAVGPGDRAAAGAHRVHVDHRVLDRDPVDDGVGGRLHLAVDHEGDVGARAAHVERQEIAVAADLGRVSSPDRRRRQARRARTRTRAA